MAESNLIMFNTTNDDNSQRQLQAIANNATLALFIMDEHQRCVFMNPAAERLTGYRLAEVQQQPLHYYLHNTHPDGTPYPQDQCPINRVFDKKAPVQGEEIFVRKDGSFFPIAFTASLIQEGDKTVGTIIEVRDISAEKQAQEILIEREHLANLNTEVSLALIQSRPLQEILNLCSQAIAKYLNAALVRIWTFDSHDEQLILQASAGIYTHINGEHARVPLGKYKVGLIALERQPYITNEVIINNQIFDQDWARRENITAFAGYPLIVENNLVGVIGLFAHKALTKTATDALATVANIIALGINHKKAEKILRASEERYRALVEISPQIVWQGSPDGYISYCNQYWLDYTGLTQAETQGDGWLSAVQPDYRDRVKTEWLKGTSTGHWEMEIPFRRAADGEYRWHVSRGFAIRDASDQIIRWIGVATDIHESHEIAVDREKLLAAERSARNESETIRKLGQMISAELDLHKIVQAVTDASTELIGAQFGSFFYNVINDKGESYLLYTLSGVPREAFANFPMPRNTAVFSPTFKGEGTVRSDDITKDPRFGKNKPYFGMPKGHLPVVSYLAVSVISRAGEVLGGLFFGHHKPGVFSERDERIVEALAVQAAVAMDNARLFEEVKRERARAQSTAQENERLLMEAQEASRLKDDFLAIVSHELRTPLNAILGWSSILLAKTITDEDGEQRAIETINRNARSQAQIIEDILDISRIITGKLRLDVQLVQPNRVIEAALDSLLHAAEAKNVRLQMLLDPQAGPISGDPERLQQIIWNLVSNAIKFTPRGGRVQIRLERVESQIEIAVSDTGQGISPEFLPAVFDRFRQADSSVSRKHGGLGLGLAIAKQLVEMHGGNIKVESPGDNQGATFTISLPVAVVTNNAVNSSERVHPTASYGQVTFQCPIELNGLRILIVDDEKDSRDLLKGILSLCHANVFTVSSAAQALDIMPEFEPQILVSDIGMPGQTGYELIREVREREKANGWKKLPAIALTAYARVEDRLKALSAGFQMHVPKPVEPAELVTVIVSLID